MKRFLGAVLCAFCLAACGGGGGAIAPSALPTQPGGTTSSQRGAAKIQVRIPAPSSTSARRRNFVSAGVQGATVAVGPHGGTLTTYAFDLSATSALCVTSGGSRSCTMTVTAPFGVDDFSITLYDAAPVSGTIPASAHVLGQANDDSISITLGGTLPTMNVYVLGTIANIGLNNNLITFPADHTTHAANVTIDPVDFANQPIVTGSPDPYGNPITVTLTESGGTGDMQLTIDGAVVTSPYTLSQSGHTIGVTYDGAGTTGDYATLSFSATGATTQTLDIAPLYITPNNPYSNGTLVQFTAPGQSQLFSVSEAQGALTYSSSVTSGSPCSAAAATGPITGTTANGAVTFLSGASPAAATNGCQFTIADSNGTSMSFPFINTVTGSGPINIGGITEYVVMNNPEPIIAGPDGNVWFGSTGATAVEKITSSGTATQYSTSPHTVLSMTDATDGNMWYVDGTNVVAQLTTAGVSTFYSVGTAGTSFTSIAQGPDGNAWALDTTNGMLYDVSAYGTTLNTYAVGCAHCVAVASFPSAPLGVYVLDNASPSAKLWFVQPGQSPSSATLRGSSPQAMAADASGNIYVTDGTNTVETYNIGASSVDPNGVINLPAGTAPRGIAVDGIGNAWVAGSGNDSIVKVTAPSTASPSVSAFTIPTSGAFPIGVTLGPDGRIWFTEFSASKIGVIQP